MVTLTEEQMMKLAKDSAGIFGMAIILASVYVKYLMDHGLKDMPQQSKKQKLELTGAQGLELLKELTMPLGQLAHAVEMYMANHKDLMAQGVDAADVIKEAIEKGIDNPGKVN